MPPAVREIDIRAISAALCDGALNQVLYRVGDRWSHSILMALFTGSGHFQELQQRLGIPKQTLSIRLKQLVEFGVVKPRIDAGTRGRGGYQLTPAGLGLYPVALASWSWDRRWDKSRQLPERLFHSSCSHSFQPRFICRECGAAVQPRGVSIVAHDGPPTRPDSRWVAPRTPRWQGSLADAAGPIGKARMYAWLGDRWLLLIVGAVLLGCHRYDQLIKVLGISTNILATRLEILCEAEILVKQQDNDDGRRLFYRLSRSGEDLFYNIILLEQWGRTHGLARIEAITLVHQACGKTLDLVASCSHCSRELDPRTVTFGNRA